MVILVEQTFAKVYLASESPCLFYGIHSDEAHHPSFPFLGFGRILILAVSQLAVSAVYLLAAGRNGLEFLVPHRARKREKIR